MGGGLAGLSAAYYLGRAGLDVELFEADDGLGGLARSFDLQGLSVERYYHFLCLPDRDLLDLAGELGLRPLWRRTGTTFFYGGRLYPFTSPLDLLRFDAISLPARVTMGLEALRWGTRSEWGELDRTPARDWLLSRVGEEAYRVVWEPLLTSKFGDRHGEVSAAWIWHRVHRVAKSRKSAVHPQVMGFFPGGTAALVERLRERILAAGGRIHLDSPVEAVLAREGRAAGIRVRGVEVACDAVVAATPLPRAAALLPEELAGYRAELEAVDYLGVLCVTAWLERSVTGSFWCNVNDPELELIGVIEMSELNPATARGGALVYVPFYLPEEAPLFQKPDEEVYSRVMGELARLAEGRPPQEALAYRVFRSRHAQPVCPVGFRERIPAHRTPLAGLYLIDATQMYPMDRTLSGTVGLARETTRTMLRDLARRP